MKLKFRAWNKKLNKMAEVKSIITMDYVCVGEIPLWLEHGCLDLDYSHTNMWQIDAIELMQWTGLVDKNGKELYEGDVIVFYPPWGAHAHLVERSKHNHNLIFTELYVRNLYPDEYNELDEINTECGTIEGNMWASPEIVRDNTNDK